MATAEFQFTQPFPCNNGCCKHTDYNHFLKPTTVHISDGFLHQTTSIYAAVKAHTTEKQQRKSQENDLNTIFSRALLKDSNAITNTYAYASFLQACTHLKQIKQAHAHMLRNELSQNIF